MSATTLSEELDMRDEIRQTISHLFWPGNVDEILIDTFIALIKSYGVKAQLKLVNTILHDNGILRQVPSTGQLMRYRHQLEAELKPELSEGDSNG